MLDQSKSELEKTTQQLSEKYESIDDEGNFLHRLVCHSPFLFEEKAQQK